MSTAQVLSVPEGSLIVLTGVHFGSEWDPPDCNAEAQATGEFIDQIAEAVGHHKFALINLADDGNVEVLSDPEQFPEWLAEKIAQTLARNDSGTP